LSTRGLPVWGSISGRLPERSMPQTGGAERAATLNRQAT
jgi:hypothetical protein